MYQQYYHKIRKFSECWKYKIKDINGSPVISKKNVPDKTLNTRIAKRYRTIHGWSTSREHCFCCEAVCSKFAAWISNSRIFLLMTGKPLISLTSIFKITGLDFQSISMTPKFSCPVKTFGWATVHHSPWITVNKLYHYKDETYLP